MLLLLAVLLSIITSKVDAQSTFYGGQSNGVRETLIGINAYCDFTCSNAQTSNWVNQCLQNGFRQRSPITQILLQCSAQMGYTISCNQNSLVQLENCVVRMANYGYQAPSPGVTRCLRQVLVPQVTSCMRMRYPRLNRYLPFSGVGIYSSIGSVGVGTGYGSGIGLSAYG